MSRPAPDIGYLAIVVVANEVGEQADHGPVDAVGREHLEDVLGVLAGDLVVAVAGVLQVGFIGHRSKVSGER